MKKIFACILMILQILPTISFSVSAQEEEFSISGESADITVSTVVNPDNSHRYAVYDIPMTWTEAKQYCESLGGHLVTITSSSEQSFVEGLLASAVQKHYWLGASDSSAEGKWTWITDEAWSFTNWDKNEPNNYRNVEDYLQIFNKANPNVYGSKRFKWNDISNEAFIKGEESFFSTQYTGFICEWDDINKAIIVVPGITGSELFGNTVGAGVKKIWLGANLSTVHALLGDLKCDESGNSINDIFTLDESFSPYGTAMPTKAPTYKNLVTDLKRFYEPEYDVRFFSYDWRLTNTLSADKLHNFIEENDYDEVILVAHSMGGIVSSLYIDKYGDSKIDKLITLGTPYYGSPKAFNALENGEFLDGLPKLIGIDNAVIKNIVPNMPGLYELLPSKGYYQNGNYFAEYRNNGLNYSQMMEQIYPICSWYNSLLINQANNIYESLNTTYNNIICGSTDTYVIVGYNTNTVTCYEYINIDGYDLGVSDLDINPAGDGTVPLISATLNFANFKRDPYYVDGINHTELASDGKCLQLVKNIINGNGDNDFGENNPNSYNYNCEGAVCRDIEIVKEKGWFKTTTKVIARCPVALEIYSKDGTLLGKITPDGIETDSEHFYDFYALGDNNETKIAYVDGDVDIVVTGTGEGTMDFAIEKYTGDELTSTVTYNDVPITETTIIETDSDLNKNAKLDLRENADADEQEILPDTLTVEAVLGDINGDTEVTPEDYNILIDYFSGKLADVAISSAAADLNDDGRVTRADAMILARYLAKWPGYAEKYFQ